MHRYRRLMVGLARTEPDSGLIRYAASIARLGTAEEIRFVHVLASSTGAEAAHDHDHVLGELRSEVHTHFTNVPATVRTSCDVLHGPLIDALLAHVAEQSVDLLFIGSHDGRRPLARRLAMKAPCSVWMVPEGSPVKLERILVPIDFSEHAADAMKVAMSMAQLSGHTECLALHVYFNEAVITYEEYDQVLRGEEREAYQRFIGPIDCQGVKVTPLFEEGINVTHVIDRVAAQRGIDLVVMATRGRSRSAAILLGSVTEHTIIESRVPLLVVKHFGARMGVLQALLDRRFRQEGRLHTD